MNVIDFKKVRRAYVKGTDVLKDVTFRVQSGEVVGLLGRNGAGKTTLIRIAMGMLEAQAGTARLFGLDPRDEPLEVKRRVGYVSEDQVLPPFMRVREVIALHRKLFADWDDDLARRLVERFQLPLGSKISQMSKGQARQVALLCAVSHRPELLLLDEPAGGLDPAARREFLETSIQLLNESGSTILFSSHHLTDVERMADRVVLIHEGELLLDSDMDHMRENYSIALVPYEANGDGSIRRSLARHDNCIAVRERDDALHAVFALPPDGVHNILGEQFGITGAHCRTAALEEMFIELVEGQS
jgi:ABC-2 type transport system ATP-binding protein